MFKDIYKQIKKYNNIVIVRHIGADPDALASQIALRDSIRVTFPDKKVLAIGNTSTRFNYFPSLDKFEELEDSLLIVVDTPDKKRIDYNFSLNHSKSIKIDHHPFIEKYCDIEYIDDTACSASQLILELINNTELKINKSIAETIYLGIVSDTNRFLFNSCTSKTFALISDLLKDFDLDLQSLYKKLYLRPLSEVKLQGFIGQNFTVSENGLAYVKISDDVLNKYKVDVGSAGNMVNYFNFIDEILVWVTITEDVKNNLFKLNIRSRGPIVNTTCEKYSGGGHKFASGARVTTMNEVDSLLEDLDYVCKKYIDEGCENNENK